jgi:C1A family cysteine protease
MAKGIHAAVGVFVVVLIGLPISLAQDRLPESFDLRDQDVLTPVKHQLNCGSCGEFAAVALFESLVMRETGISVDLSEQQIVSCVPGCGCRSGCSSLKALEYIKQNGVVSESEFPYLDKDTACISDLRPEYYITEVFSTNIDKMALSKRIKTIKETVHSYGPVATNMALYEDLDRYEDGVYSCDVKSRQIGGHWILIVGWADKLDLPGGGYWICRNSWGEKWGDNGYFKSAYGDVTGIDDYYIVYGSYTPKPVK